MKTITLLLLALIGLTAMAIQNANAGAAVATDTLGNMATAYGGPVQREKQRALAEASRRYGPNVRILASTDIPGYGAIAVARHPNGRNWLVGVALGMRSATEAYVMAINLCRKAGGTRAQVRWSFRG